ncbi:cytidylate kinase [Paenibacillus yonginensis]|uniref:Cytidylate kinase n=1 Tax=Paenibacillus yonginensis TaxID=1462996 RepID=A0A1B1N0B7_9BACL|nr:(d)CMP kinase [Paenibacillus yonginensis]ANS74877.1 cytidylate kinase [Paenibacillus yonginensis]
MSGQSEGYTNSKINIAIDGPAGAGKSTVARMVAGKLGYVYVDTGAMYRAVTLRMLELGIPPENEDKVLQVARDMVIELKPGEEGQKVLLDGKDVTEQIRSTGINANVSRYAQIEGLRALMVSLQRQMALRKGVVMDGRDIGTTVLPTAEVKVFMTAAVEERARRRFQEMKDPESTSLEQLTRDIAERDRLDAEREVSPLRQASDAVLLDTTRMTISEVSEAIVSLCEAYGMERSVE